MMKLLVLMGLVASVCAKHEEYIGWKSYYLGPSNQEQLQAIGRLHQELELDILSDPILGREGVTLVRPEHHDAFIKAMDQAGIAYRVHRENVKAALDYDDMVIERRSRERKARNSREMPYDSYQRLNVIYEYLEGIARQYPDLVTLVTPANSFNGRPIKYLKISTTNFEDESKPVIYIDSGIHAREWITPPTVTYAIQKLVENVTESDLLEQFDWILLPVINPDGYEYTFTRERFWRKSRSYDIEHNILSLYCRGVDGNRNFNFFWNTIGTHISPCSDIFAGSRAFSESETRVVRDIIHEHLHRMALYLTIHSYGSMILYPWAHNASLPSNGFDLHIVGVAMAEKISEIQLPHFPKYVVGNAGQVLWYQMSGSSDNYARFVGVPLTFTYELPGFDEGENGFHLDPIYIEQVVKETWEGIVVGVRLAGDMWRRK